MSSSIELFIKENVPFTTASTKVGEILLNSIMSAYDLATGEYYSHTTNIERKGGRQEMFAKELSRVINSIVRRVNNVFLVLSIASPRDDIDPRAYAVGYYMLLYQAELQPKYPVASADDGTLFIISFRGTSVSIPFQTADVNRVVDTESVCSIEMLCSKSDPNMLTEFFEHFFATRCRGGHAPTIGRLSKCGPLSWQCFVCNMRHLIDQGLETVVGGCDWKQMMNVQVDIATRLLALSPAIGEITRTLCMNFLVEIENSDMWTRGKFFICPPKQHPLIVDHGRAALAKLIPYVAFAHVVQRFEGIARKYLPPAWLDTKHEMTRWYVFSGMESSFTNFTRLYDTMTITFDEMQPPRIAWRQLGIPTTEKEGMTADFICPTVSELNKDSWKEKFDIMSNRAWAKIEDVDSRERFRRLYKEQMRWPQFTLPFFVAFEREKADTEVLEARRLAMASGESDTTKKIKQEEKEMEEYTYWAKDV